MARKGQTALQFNSVFFDNIMKTAKVENLTEETAGRVLGIAKSTAPVDTGAYRDGLHVERHESKFRKVVRVVGSDPKTLLVEAKTGTLARALKAAKR